MNLIRRLALTLAIVAVLALSLGAAEAQAGWWPFDRWYDPFDWMR